MSPHAPSHYIGVVPYLYCKDAAALAAWLENTFGFEVLRSFPDEQGKVRNVELRVGSCEVWLDCKPEARAALRGVSDWVGVYVDDVASVAQRAKAAGASCGEPMDRPWGVREIQISDPEGYCWGFMERRT